MTFFTPDTLPRHSGSTLVIGNFDGVHRGHRALLDAARQYGAPVVALTFEPHPREYFAKDAAPFRLTLADAKARLLHDYGASHVVPMAFDGDLATLDARAFIDRVILGGIGAARVVVGADFAFGRGRGGTVETLAQAGLQVTALPPLHDETGAVYSSSRVRDCIRAGDFAGARLLSGHDWVVTGPVLQGDRRGRELGYPTANQSLDGLVLPPFGIYAVRIAVDGDDRIYDGVANLGIRPMFALERPILETHIFDFSAEIYGENLRVTPVAFLRGEARFDSLESLKSQIKQDCLAACAVLKSGSL